MADIEKTEVPRVSDKMTIRQIPNYKKVNISSALKKVKGFDKNSKLDQDFEKDFKALLEEYFEVYRKTGDARSLWFVKILYEKHIDIFTAIHDLYATNNIKYINDLGDFVADSFISLLEKNEKLFNKIVTSKKFHTDIEKIANRLAKDLLKLIKSYTKSGKKDKAKDKNGNENEDNSSALSEIDEIADLNAKVLNTVKLNISKIDNNILNRIKKMSSNIAKIDIQSIAKPKHRKLFGIARITRNSKNKSKNKNKNLIPDVLNNVSETNSKNKKKKKANNKLSVSSSIDRFLIDFGSKHPIARFFGKATGVIQFVQTIGRLIDFSFKIVKIIKFFSSFSIMGLLKMLGGIALGAVSIVGKLTKKILAAGWKITKKLAKIGIAAFLASPVGAKLLGYVAGMIWRLAKSIAKGIKKILDSIAPAFAWIGNLFIGITNWFLRVLGSEAEPIKLILTDLTFAQTLKYFTAKYFESAFKTIGSVIEAVYSKLTDIKMWANIAVNGYKTFVGIYSVFAGLKHLASGSMNGWLTGGLCGLLSNTFDYTFQNILVEVFSMFFPVKPKKHKLTIKDLYLGEFGVSESVKEKNKVYSAVLANKVKGLNINAIIDSQETFSAFMSRDLDVDEYNHHIYKPGSLMHLYSIMGGKNIDSDVKNPLTEPWIVDGKLFGIKKIQDLFYDNAFGLSKDYVKTTIIDKYFNEDLDTQLNVIRNYANNKNKYDKTFLTVLSINRKKIINEFIENPEYLNIRKFLFIDMINTDFKNYPTDRMTNILSILSDGNLESLKALKNDKIKHKSKAAISKMMNSESFNFNLKFGLSLGNGETKKVKRGKHWWQGNSYSVPLVFTAYVNGIPVLTDNFIAKIDQGYDNFGTLSGKNNMYNDVHNLSNVNNLTDIMLRKLCSQTSNKVINLLFHDASGVIYFDKDNIPSIRKKEFGTNPTGVYRSGYPNKDISELTQIPESIIKLPNINAIKNNYLNIKNNFIEELINEKNPEKLAKELNLDPTAFKSALDNSQIYDIAAEIVNKNDFKDNIESNSNETKYLIYAMSKIIDAVHSKES